MDSTATVANEVVLSRRESTLKSMGETLYLLEKRRAGFVPLRGMVQDVVRNRGGQPAGLLMDIGGYSVFVPASSAEGLCSMPDEELRGLILLVSVTGADFIRRTFIASARAAYEATVKNLRPPVPGKLSSGIPLVPVGDNILVLLPRGCRGLLDGGSLGLPREKWKKACGARLLFLIGGRSQQNGSIVYAVSLPEESKEARP
jgi:hypothetical protein